MNITKSKRIALARLLALVQQINTNEGVLLFVEGDLVLDAEVFVEGEDGNMVPAPDGTYTTTDGKTIVVATGKVTEIKEAESPIDDNPEAAVEEKTAEDTPEDTPEGEDIDALKSRIAELETAIAEKDERIAELEAKIAELEAATPAAESIEQEDKKKNFEQDADKTLVQRLLSRSQK